MSGIVNVFDLNKHPEYPDAKGSQPDMELVGHTKEGCVCKVVVYGSQSVRQVWFELESEQVRMDSQRLG